MHNQRYNVGDVALWRWVAPSALADGTIPAVTFTRNGASILSDDLSPLGAEITLSAYGTDTSGTEFVTSDDLENTAFLAQEENRAAFIITPGSGAFPVEVIRATEGQTSIFIANPLPRKIEFPATLQWATWAIEIDQTNVTSTASRNITWKVLYDPLSIGAYTPTDSEQGRIIVERVFETGLDTTEFLVVFPEFSQKNRSSDNSFDRFIKAARDLLLTKIICAARKQGVTESEFFGPDFYQPHMYLTAYLIAKHNEPEQAKVYYDMAIEMIEVAIDIGWLDKNIDNQVDSGEEGGSNPRISVASASQRLLPASSYILTCHNPNGPYRGCYGPYNGYYPGGC